jgi:hypothetical protein
MAQANATPGLQIEVFDGTTLMSNTVFNGTSFVPASNSGIADVLDDSDANFSNISVSVQGIPKIPSPNLSSTTIDASTSGIALPTTLTVLVTQTGVSMPLENLASTFTFNALTGQSETAVFQNWIDKNDVAFGMTTPITSAVTLTPDVGSAGPITIAEGPLTLFSETEQYVISFGGGQQSVSLDSQIIDAPEPMTFAILGVGLCALGFTRRVRVV